jgi:hypothetical protein
MERTNNILIEMGKHTLKQVVVTSVKNVLHTSTLETKCTAVLHMHNCISR